MMPAKATSLSQLSPISRKASYNVTLSVTVVEWLKLPLVPQIVIVYAPRELPLVCTVSVDVPEPLMLDGENVAVMPLGKLVTLRFAVPLNPPLPTMHTV